MGNKDKEVATQANVAEKQSVESIFAVNGYVKIKPWENVNYIVIDEKLPEGGNIWLTVGAVLANPLMANLFQLVKKFYLRKNDELVKNNQKKLEFSDMEIVRNILKHFAFHLEFEKNEEGNWNYDMESFIVGPMNEDVDKKLDAAFEEEDEENIKFFFNPKPRKVFNF